MPHLWRNTQRCGWGLLPGTAHPVSSAQPLPVSSAFLAVQASVPTPPGWHGANGLHDRVLRADEKGSLKWSPAWSRCSL